MNRPFRLILALVIAVALIAMWFWGIGRMSAFGFVPPVPGWWPVEFGPVNPKLVYYLAVVAVWIGITVVGVRIIMTLIRRRIGAQGENYSGTD